MREEKAALTQHQTALIPQAVSVGTAKFPPCLCVFHGCVCSLSCERVHGHLQVRLSRSQTCLTVSACTFIWLCVKEEEEHSEDWLWAMAGRVLLMRSQLYPCVIVSKHISAARWCSKDFQDPFISLFFCHNCVFCVCKSFVVLTVLAGERTLVPILLTSST